MDFVKTVLHGFGHGLVNSLAGFYLIFSYDAEVQEKPRSSSQETNLAKRRAAQQAEKKQKQPNQEDPRVTHRVFQCCVLNGIVFGLSLFLFNYVFQPVLKHCLSFFMGERAGAIWVYVQPTMSYLFELIWVIPLFLLSKVINVFWFQDIADSAYRQRQGRPQGISNFSKYLSDMFISIVIEFFFLIQASLMRMLPLMGINIMISCVHLCLLNSLYAFEYRWYNMGFELYKRLSFIEENWPYFLGFGMPLTFITMYTPSLYVSGCLFAVLFPVFIISANEADPVVNPTGCSLQLFSLVVWLSNKIIQSLVTKSTPQTPSKNYPTHLHSSSNRISR